MYYIGERYNCPGDTEKAKEYIEQARQVEGYAEEALFPGRYYEMMGEVLIAEGKLKEAIEAQKQGAEIYKRYRPPMAGLEMMKLGRAHLAQGKKQEAVKDFLEAEPLLSVAYSLASIGSEGQKILGIQFGGLP